jgi:hypothetical protein
LKKEVNGRTQCYYGEHRTKGIRSFSTKSNSSSPSQISHTRQSIWSLSLSIIQKKSIFHSFQSLILTKYSFFHLGIYVLLKAEKSKKDAIKKAERVSDLLVEAVNGGVQDSFIYQKRIELEIRALANTITRFTKQTDQWLNATHSLNTALKVLSFLNFCVFCVCTNHGYCVVLCFFIVFLMDSLMC